MSRTRWQWFLWGVAVLAGSAAGRPAAAQDASEFLKRLDTNGNGMIDPAEVEGRMGSFLQRMAENNPRLDFSRPVPISRVAEEFTRMREERGASGPPGGGPGGPGGGPQGRGGSGGGPPGGGPPGRGSSEGRSGGERGGDERGAAAGASRPGPTKIEPLVPGFGVEEVLTPPPGFGAEGELFSVTITEQDRQEAARAFQYYDADRNGKIDAEEMKRSRYGSDLLLYDRNRDGVLTLNEMEYRYARRRMENARAGGGGAPAAANQGGEQRDRGSTRGRGSNEGATAGSGNSRPTTYRVVPAGERLPAGLPDWFARNDADGDGQVTMAEYSATWSAAVLADFAQFDLNQDGLITPEECLRATQNGAVRGTAVASAPTAAPAAAGAPAPVAASSAAPAAASSSRPPAGGVSGIDPRYLDYYSKLVAKYDTNGDGVLSPDEWANMSKNPEAADADGDKRITVEEYARWSMQR